MNTVEKFVAILLMLTNLEFMFASNSDGICTFLETYADEPEVEAYTDILRVTLNCIPDFWNTCYENKAITKTRLKPPAIKTTTKKKCCQGYTFKDEKCMPTCLPKCRKGQCTAPNVCTCDPGYVQIPPSNRCIPQCKEGYKLNALKTECDPICDDCNNNRICVAPNQCACADGFELNETDSKCIPKCSGGCLNGKCVSPEKCVCNPGYSASSTSESSSICKEDWNGTCTEPNSCTCFNGHELHNESHHLCKPICSSGCLNGSCVKPEVCQCDKGFKLSAQTKECLPVCNEKCVNAKCTSPNICTCEEGFRSTSLTRCDIICDNCTHGHCVERNVCQCDTGYHRDIEEKVCVKDECSSNKMEDNCKNGYCSDGICVCEFGYQINTSLRTCAPTCSMQCNNGFCSAPDICGCYDGYELSTIHGNNCTNSTAKIYPVHLKDADVRVAGLNSMYLWIIVVGVILGTICALSIFVYVKHFKKVSYRCGPTDSKVIYNFNDDELNDSCCIENSFGQLELEVVLI